MSIKALFATAFFIQPTFQVEVPGYFALDALYIDIYSCFTAHTSDCDEFTWSLADVISDMSYYLAYVEFWKDTDQSTNTDLAGFRLTFESPTQP